MSSFTRSAHELNLEHVFGNNIFKIIAISPRRNEINITRTHFTLRKDTTYVAFTSELWINWSWNTEFNVLAIPWLKLDVCQVIYYRRGRRWEIVRQAVVQRLQNGCSIPRPGQKGYRLKMVFSQAFFIKTVIIHLKDKGIKTCFKWELLLKWSTIKMLIKKVFYHIACNMN